MQTETNENTGAPTEMAGAATEAEIKIPCEVYSRIVGYLRPTVNWNAGKVQEFTERVMFDNALEVAGED